MADLQIENMFEGPGKTALTADGVPMIADFPNDSPGMAVVYAPGKGPGEGSGWPAVRVEATHVGPTREELVDALAEGALAILRKLSPQNFPAPAEGGE